MYNSLKDFTQELYDLIKENESNQEKLKEIYSCMNTFKEWLSEHDNLFEEDVDFLIELYKGITNTIEDENFTLENRQADVINKKRIETIETYIGVLKANLDKCLELEWVNDHGYNFIEKFINKSESVLDEDWTPTPKITKSED